MKHPVTDGVRVVVLVSGTGSILAALLAADLGAHIVGVVSDQADAPALDRAREAGVATAVVGPKEFATRDDWNLALAKTIGAFSPDVVVCAGFMRILGAPVLDRFPTIVNTHPSLLPAFPGAHGVRDALAYGVKVTGCTVHLVDAGLDSGPILAQRALPIPDGISEADLHEQIKQIERELVVDVVRNLAAAQR